jgi:hypothetical protein
MVKMNNVNKAEYLKMWTEIFQKSGFKVSKSCMKSPVDLIDLRTGEIMIDPTHYIHVNADDKRVIECERIEISKIASILKEKKEKYTNFTFYGFDGEYEIRFVRDDDFFNPLVIKGAFWNEV